MTKSASASVAAVCGMLAMSAYVLWLKRFALDGMAGQ
jgi:hypothetical protein